MKIQVNVNGIDRELEVSPGTSLNDALRNILGLTGVKRGCDSGGCGTCTVLLDGKPVYSCMTPSWKADGRNVLTVEGLEKDGKLHVLQEEFIKNFAPQCGYCTPAMLMVGKALLDENPNPSEEEVRLAISGVLCRCTGYLPYIKSIMDASRLNSK